MAFCIVPIVEGQGEGSAVPELLRRVIAALNPGVPIQPVRPIRLPRGKLKPGEIERAVQLAANKLLELGGMGAVFIIVDSEGECPARLGPELLARAQTARPDKSTFVVLAHQEFEAWFLASAASLKGQCGLNHAIEDHTNPESVQGCKEWLKGWMPAARKYSETADQVALAAKFDLNRGRNAPSFDKLWRDLENICQIAEAGVGEA